MESNAVISLFDLSGAMVAPWADGGYRCLLFDMQHGEAHRWAWQGRYTRTGGMAETWADALDQAFAAFDVRMVAGFPPCTDLAVSGNRWRASKAAANPDYLADAMALVYLVRDIAEAHGVPYMVENPIGVVSTMWRKPDYMFDPCDYGGYLPEDDVSPYPGIIPPRDAYTKKTCLWTGNGFVMPEKRPVEPERITASNGDNYSGPHWKLGGKSLRTKNIRSSTPRGFANAVYAANG